jgi:hypothetical protein
MVMKVVSMPLLAEDKLAFRTKTMKRVMKRVRLMLIGMKNPNINMSVHRLVGLGIVTVR